MGITLLSGVPPLVRREPHGSIWRGLTEQTGEQGYEDETDERDTAAGHKLSYP